MLVNMYK